MLISMALVFIFLPAYPDSTAAHSDVSPFKEKIDRRTDGRADGQTRWQKETEDTACIQENKIFTKLT